MSWDIFIQDFPHQAKTIDEIPPDFDPQPIGMRTYLIQQICEVIPDADFSDPSWGLVDGNGFSIEINLGNNELVTSFALHIRGSNDSLIDLIEKLLQHLKLRALDPGSDTGFFDAEQSRSSFQRWVEYRDKVVGNRYEQANDHSRCRTQDGLDLFSSADDVGGVDRDLE